MTTRAAPLSHKIAGKLGLAHLLLAPDRGDPIILMYHGVNPDDAPPPLVTDHKHVSESGFRSHLRMMAAHRQVVPLTTLVDGLLKGKNCKGMVAVTFDDGYLNNAECAAGVLREFSMCATFFLATGFIGQQRWAWTDRVEDAVSACGDPEARLPLRAIFGPQYEGPDEVRVGPVSERRPLLRRLKAELKKLSWQDADARVAAIVDALQTDRPPHGEYRFMSWQQARDLATAGFEVGAHTVNHAILSRVSRDSAEEEIVGSQERVTSELGSCCRTFCYPNGKAQDFNEGVMDICSRNFDAALSAMVGVARIEDRFQIRRIGVEHATTDKRLASRILRGE